jgi:hypothetical protein
MESPRRRRRRGFGQVATRWEFVHGEWVSDYVTPIIILTLVLALATPAGAWILGAGARVAERVDYVLLCFGADAASAVAVVARAGVRIFGKRVPLRPRLDACSKVSRVLEIDAFDG